VDFKTLFSLKKAISYQPSAIGYQPVMELGTPKAGSTEECRKLPGSRAPQAALAVPEAGG